MYKTKREKALEQDIAEANKILANLGLELQKWVVMSPKMGRNPRLERQFSKEVDRALATLDYYPSGDNGYMYQS